MHGEADAIRLRDEHPAVGARAQELLGSCFEGIDRVADARNGGGIDRIFKHEEAAIVKRARLLACDQAKRPAHRRPAEPTIQLMERRARVVRRWKRAHVSITWC